MFQNTILKYVKYITKIFLNVLNETEKFKRSEYDKCDGYLIFSISFVPAYLSLIVQGIRKSCHFLCHVTLSKIEQPHNFVKLLKRVIFRHEIIPFEA